MVFILWFFSMCVICFIVSGMFVPVFLLSKFVALMDELLTYECGATNFGSLIQFNFYIRFFLFFIMFLIFDIEVLIFIPFLFNYSVIYLFFGVFASYCFIFFIFVFFFIFIFELDYNALSWDANEYFSILC